MGQAPNRQVKFGAGVYWNFKEFLMGGITFQYNSVIKNSQFKTSINYHYHQSKGFLKLYVNGKLASESYSKQWSHHFSSLIEYTIIRNKKDPNRGLAIGIGPGLAFFKKNGIDNYYGPGGAIKLEYQGIIKKNWYFGVELFGLYFADLNKEHVDTTGKLSLMPPTLTVGLRF
jgi:hypothetical protein